MATEACDISRVRLGRKGGLMPCVECAGQHQAELGESLSSLPRLPPQPYTPIPSPALVANIPIGSSPWHQVPGVYRLVAGPLSRANRLSPVHGRQLLRGHDRRLLPKQQLHRQARRRMWQPLPKLPSVRQLHASTQRRERLQPLGRGGFLPGGGVSARGSTPPKLRRDPGK
jgi:hypothetical protein